MNKNVNKANSTYEVQLYVKGYDNGCLCRGNISTITDALNCAYEFSQTEVLDFMIFEDVPRSQFDYVKIIKFKDDYDRCPKTIAIINCN
jgi:hypothetical protein